MSIRETAVLSGFVFIGLLPFSLVQAQGSFPERPIRLVVPYPAGGFTDVATRKISDVASKYLGQPIIIENKAGANGTIGTQFVTRSAPDGYSLVVTTPTSVLIAPLLTKVPYDPVKDLSYVMNYAGPSHALLVRPDSKYQTLGNLLSDARANPGKISFGSVGTADTVAFGMAALSKAKNVSFNHIPYQGANQAMLAVMAGEIDFAPASNYYTYIKGGKLRALAVLDRQRFKAIPDVPTFKEFGINWEFPWLTAIAAPASTPEPVRARLEEAFTKAAADPEFEKFMNEANIPIVVLSGAQVKKELIDHIESFAPAAKELGLVK